MMAPAGDGPMCLVTGATGYIGGRLVPELLAAGFKVRCAARSPERLRDRPWAGRVEVVRADLVDAGSVRRALDGVEVAYYLVHAIGAGRGFGEIDRHAARIFASAAKDSGVRRIVYLGGLTPSERDRGRISEHLRSRAEVGEILLDCGVPTAALRAAVVIGAGSVSFEIMRLLTERLPVMITPRWVRTRIQPIAVRDVLRYLVGCVALPSTVNRYFDIGGPEVLTYEDMMRGYTAAAGLRRRLIVPVAALSPGLSSRWIGLVTPVSNRIARPLVESLRHELVCREHDIARFVPDPLEGLIDFDQAVRLALRRIGTADVVIQRAAASVPPAPSDPLPTDPDWAGGSLHTDLRESPVDASREALWQVIEDIGRYSWPLAWAPRDLLDRLVSGVGRRRRHRASYRPRVGDPLDLWRVEELIPRCFLRLRTRTRLPGLALLDLSVEDRAGRTWFRQRALFHPRGLAGELYWWSTRPFHKIVFGRMQHNIRRAAERCDGHV